VPDTQRNGTVPRLGAVAPLQPGDPRRVGRYVLSGRLGAGGMGTVYLGRRDGGGPPVAVKVVHRELAEDAGFRGRFADEVAAARRVAPFCTARVLDADPAAASPYLVTEFVDGVPLDTAVLERGPLDESTLHGVALGVAAALAAVHAAGIVHRDLKPGNVLLSLSGPRVIDFGIARALDAARQHTQAGLLLGTPGWMAPEQFRGGRVGPAADVFSWGSLVAYAATGRNPWGADGPPAALAHRILHAEPDLAGLGGPLRRLVEAALAKDPARRPTARQLVSVLLGDAPTPTGDPTAAATLVVERTWAAPAALSGPAPAGAPAGPGSAAGGPARPRWWAGARPGAGRAGGGWAGLAGSILHGASRAAAGRAPASGAAAWPTAVVAPGAPGRLNPTRTIPPASYPPAQPGPYPPVRQPAQPPARRRRRWWRKKRWLVPIGLLLLLVLLPYGPDGTRQQPPAPPEASATPSSDLGRPMRDGQLEFVVRDWRCGVRQLGDGPLARTPQGSFCLARVDVRDVKQEPRTLFEAFQKVRDSAGGEYEADFPARFALPDQTLWDRVNPGESVSGTMVFDLPAGATPVELELHDGALSGGVAIRLP